MKQGFRLGREIVWQWLSLACAAGTLLTFSGCGDDSGANSSTPESSCAALCDKQQGCPNDDQDTCVATCEQILDKCPAQAKAANDCTLSRPASDFSCDETGQTRLKEGVCQAESSAVIDCTLGALAGSASVGAPSGSGSNAGPTASAAASSSSASATPSTSATGSGVPGTDLGELCSSYCTSVAEVGCTLSTTECELQCSFTLGLSGQACVDSFRELTECASDDVVGNYECDASGAAKLKADVCTAEAAANTSCAAGGSNECEAFCSSDAAPPVSCAADGVMGCLQQCDVYSIFGGADCIQAFEDYTLCTYDQDASHWSCNLNDEPTFDQMGCDTEASALASVCLGIGG